MLQFACGSRVMTPEAPVFMHGFGARSEKSQGVLDDLYVKAALLVANKSLLILTIDALGSDRSFILGLKDALLERFGLQHDEVLVNFSHTHHSVFLTGVDTATRKGGYSMGQDGWTHDEEQLDYSVDEAFFVRLRDSVLELVQECRDNLTEGELLLGGAPSDFAVSRRYPVGEGVEWRPYYEGVIDKELQVLKLVDRFGALRGLMYNYGCHTTSMGPDNMKFSNDFAGETSRVLEEAYPEATALFLQGCGGELKPRMGTKDGKFISMSPEEMRQAGAALAQEIAEIVEHGSFTPVQGEFRTVMVDPLLYTEQTPASFYEAIANDPAYNAFYRSSAQRTFDAIRDGTVRDRLPHYITVWQLDDRTRLVAMEGEVSTQYSLLIKKLFEGYRTLTLGYTNGVFCYIPTRRMIGEGGYEATCNFFFKLRGPFLPEIEDIIMGQLVQADWRLR